MRGIFLSPHWGILILAWFVVDLITPVLIWLSKKVGALDKPGGYKKHAVPVPFTGGVAVFIGVTVAVFSILRFQSFEAARPLFGIVLCGFLTLIVGLIDGFVRVHAVLKLLLLAVITYVLSGFGIMINVLPAWPSEAFDVLNMTLTLLWIVGVTSAMNSLDNMDGAATGVAALAALTIFAIGWKRWEAWTTYFALALGGATLGFLRYNFKPAKIFLGDNGSFCIGFMLAALTVFAGWSDEDPVKAVIVPLLVLGVPIFDIVVSTILRYFNKEVRTVKDAIVYCGRDHTTHRLMALGLSERQTAIFLYFMSVFLGAVAYVICLHITDRVIYTGIAVGVALCGVLFAIILNRAPVYVKASESKES